MARLRVDQANGGLRAWWQRPPSPNHSTVASLKGDLGAQPWAFPCGAHTQLREYHGATRLQEASKSLPLSVPQFPCP